MRIPWIPVDPPAGSHDQADWEEVEDLGERIAIALLVGLALVLAIVNLVPAG
jgi:hypothetical protein